MAGPIEINAGRPVLTLTVENAGDRPIQVGSHYHFAEANPALSFDRDAARGMRLDVPAGTSVRFEPGIEMEVALVPFVGKRIVAGLRGQVGGPLVSFVRRATATARCTARRRATASASPTPTCGSRSPRTAAPAATRRCSVAAK